MKQYYNTSKDYKELFQLIVSGHEIACFVNYDWRDGTITRDIARVRTSSEDKIYISCRGVEYASVESFEVSRNMPAERLFVRACKGIDLEWIK